MRDFLTLDLSSLTVSGSLSSAEFLSQPCSQDSKTEIAKERREREKRRESRDRQNERGFLTLDLSSLTVSGSLTSAVVSFSTLFSTFPPRPSIFFFTLEVKKIFANICPLISPEIHSIPSPKDFLRTSFNFKNVLYKGYINP